jgi:acyl-CoA synthetase (AMP-forming)/AMP-acid ligase II
MRTGVFGQVMRHDSRLLARIGPSTGGGFIAPLRTWWFGGTVCLVEASPENLRILDVRALLVSPAQLRDLIRRLPKDSEPLPNLTVLAGGTALPVRLNAQARRRLTPNVVMTYGATETGTAAVARTTLLEADPSVTGIVLPWVDVEVLDEQGHALPAGEFGEIRIRTNEMVHEYFDDAEATESHFKDGWFHPGDVGSVSADGKLRLLGRSDDVLNFGGAKISPRLLEDEVAKHDAVVDQAAFAAPHRSGLSLPWVAVVTSGGFDAKAAAAGLKAAFPWLTVPTNFIIVDAIPRNEMGKPDRAQLQALAAASTVATGPAS